MQVMCNSHRIDAVHGLEVLKALLEKLHGLIVFHVADMLARDCEPSLGQGKSILEIGAATNDLRPVIMQHEGIRRIASGSPKE